MAKVQDVLGELMRRKGVTAYRIEKDTNRAITSQAISRVINGEREPRPSTLKILADYFGVTVAQFLGEEPLPNNTDEINYPAGPCRDDLNPKLWAKIPGDIGQADKVIIRTFFDARGGFNLQGIANIDNLAVQLVWQYLYYCMLDIAEGEG